MEQLLAAGGNQLSRLTNGGKMVLLQQRRGFLKLLLQGAGSLKLVVIARPDALPVKAQGTEHDHGQTEAGEYPRGCPMEACQNRRLTLDPPGRKGTLQHL